MKYTQRCYTEQEVHDYIYSHLQTDEFRRSYREQGFIYDVVDRFAKLPRAFGVMSDDANEWAHFSAWWGIIPERNYRNPVISDLYYLHEMTHAGRMAYIPNQSFEGFARRLFENELEASVVSEIQVYFELPALRAHSFDHEIYADRFLQDTLFCELWQQDKDTAIAYIKEARRELYYAGPEIESDLCGRWVKRFAHQNQAWADIWHRRYNEIETAMHQLQRDCLNPAVGRKLGLDRFMDWLQSDDITPPSTEIPFPDEATAFAAIYGLMKGNYNKDMEILSKNNVQHTPFYPTSMTTGPSL